MLRLRISFAILSILTPVTWAASEASRKVSPLNDTDLHNIMTTKLNSSDQPAPIENKTEVCERPFEDTVFRCWPEDVMDTEFLTLSVSEHHQYKLTCRPGFFLPLGSTGSWTCNDQTITPHKCDEESYIPLECVEETLPRSIYLDQLISVNNKELLDCNPAIGKKNYKTGLFRFSYDFVHRGLLFFIRPVPSSVGCQLVFDKDGRFQKVDTTVTFRMIDKPTGKFLPAGTFHRTRNELTQVATSTMERLKMEGDILNYQMGRVSGGFLPGQCGPGGMLEEKDLKQEFTTEIPICRMCMRGWYLHARRCRPCETGYYSDAAGATQCTECPSAHPVAVFASKSLFSCYPEGITRRGRWEALLHGLYMWSIFNLTWMFLLIWNVRSYIRNVIRMRTGSMISTEL